MALFAIVVIAAVIGAAVALIFGLLWGLAPRLSPKYKSSVSADITACQTKAATAPAAPAAVVEDLKIKFTLPAADATISGYTYECIKKTDPTIRPIVKAEYDGETTTRPSTVSTADLTAGIYICRDAVRHISCGYGLYGAAVEITIPEPI